MTVATLKRRTCNHRRPLRAIAKFRLTPAEKAMLEAEADAAGTTLSELLRDRVLSPAISAGRT